MNDVHVLDLETQQWSAPACSGKLPVARYGHVAAVVGEEMLVYGGRGAGGELPVDVVGLNLRTFRWTHHQTATPPPRGRFNHAATLVGTRLCVFGGWDGTQSMDDLWVLDVGSMAWIKPRCAGRRPRARHGHVMECVDGELLVFGG